MTFSTLERRKKTDFMKMSFSAFVFVLLLVLPVQDLHAPGHQLVARPEVLQLLETSAAGCRRYSPCTTGSFSVLEQVLVDGEGDVVLLVPVERLRGELDRLSAGAVVQLQSKGSGTRVKVGTSGGGAGERAGAVAAAVGGRGGHQVVVATVVYLGQNQAAVTLA